MQEKQKPKTITEYIKNAPKEAQGRLREMLESLRKAAPGAEESIKWGTPTLSYKRILFTFAAYKNHINLYPTPSVIAALEKDLQEYRSTKSAIQFPLDKPILTDLVIKVAKLRVRDLVEKDVRWM